MVFDIIRLKLFFTVCAFDELVKLLLMIISKVDIVHMPAFITFLNISTAIAKMCGNLGLRECLVAVLTDFGGLLVHFDDNLKCILKLQVQTNYGYYNIL